MTIIKENEFMYFETGSPEDYELFLPAAEAVDADDVEVFEADAKIVCQRVVHAVDAVLQHEKRIRAELPRVNLEAIRQSRALAFAMLYAALEAESCMASGSDNLSEALNIRNRFWTLVRKRYDDQVWRAGAWIFGRSVEEHVPALR